MKTFKNFRQSLLEVTAIEKDTHLEVTPDNYKKGKVKGTAIENRGNHAAYGEGGIGGADAEIKKNLTDPSKNIAAKFADEYSKKNLGHGYDMNTKHPESSLRKQYAIGQAYKLATKESPEYKKRIFDDYAHNRPDIVSSTKAKDYDSLVKGSYKAVAKETGKQFDALPVKTQYHEGGLGYHNSTEMMRDIHKHNNLTVYRGGDRHEFLHNVDPKTGLNENEKFRSVHDFAGHAVHGNQFGPKGEEVAHNEHQKLFTPAAHVALASETRGQNSVVNYSDQNLPLMQKMEQHRKMRRDALNKGDVEGANKHEEATRKAGEGWKYAEQKSVALPSKMLEPGYNGDVPDHIKSMLRDPEADKSPVYDTDKDHLNLVKLAKHHNTSSHSSLSGGKFDADKAHEDLKHIASVHGFTKLSKKPFEKE